MNYDKFLIKNFELITDNNKFNEEIFKKDNTYLNGYWQSEKYFTDKDVQNFIKIFLYLIIIQFLTNIKN